MARIELGLPGKPFLYTLDQIADLFGVALDRVKHEFIYFDNISTGMKPRDRMLARNISTTDRADWRVAEEELKRWLKHMGFRVYDRSSVRV